MPRKAARLLPHLTKPGNHLTSCEPESLLATELPLNPVTFHLWTRLPRLCSQPGSLHPDPCWALPCSPDHLFHHCSYQGRTSLFCPVISEGLFGDSFGKRSCDTLTGTVSFLQNWKHQLLSSLVAFDLSRPLILTKSYFPAFGGETSQRDKRMRRYGKGQREQRST